MVVEPSIGVEVVQTSPSPRMDSQFLVLPGVIRHRQITQVRRRTLTYADLWEAGQVWQIRPDRRIAVNTTLAWRNPPWRHDAASPTAT